MTTIRDETSGDQGDIRHVNERAFEGSNEADLIDVLRRAGGTLISLVATDGEAVVGHILFTPVEVRVPDGTLWAAAALGPMAVLPEYQGQGIGSALVREGLRMCQELGHNVVFVLGHPRFYPRFGFTSARSKGIGCEWDVADDVFMVAELTAGALGGRTGTVVYRPEFGSV